MEAIRKSSSNNRLRLSRREQTVAIVFLAFGLLGAWLPTRITVATSDSLDHRIFFLRPVTARIETGDYLVFRHRDTTPVQQGLRQDHELTIKKVGCLPGDLLTTDAERNFTCNGRILGRGLKADSKGRELPQFTFNGQIPEGKLFVVGTHPRSYDSRYFGFVDANEILHKALPLW